MKTKTDDPIPKLTFKQVQGDDKQAGVSPAVWDTEKEVQKKYYTSHANQGDTALLVIGFEDGDGDLFRDKASEANLIMTVYTYDAIRKAFVIDSVKITNTEKGPSTGFTVVQPAGGYYKGKSVQGEIGLPLADFRSSGAVTILKFEVFMIDMKNHKTNVVTSPVYTLAP